MNPTRIRLDLQARVTTLAFGDGRAISLPVGPRGLCETVLRHDPPTAGELEHAIDLVEDALGGQRIAPSDRADLVTADALLRCLPSLRDPGSALDLNEVETLFQRLASRALGTPVAADELPHGRDIAAALLILRECMHHLGFERVVAERAGPLASQTCSTKPATAFTNPSPSSEPSASRPPSASPA